MERPILFSGPMVRAILNERKTQTRRVVKPPIGVDASYAGVDFGCPYGAPGYRLWVRETFALDIACCPNGVSYRADHIDPRGDGPANPMKWRPSIYMPRWASRITLEVTGVRVERVQEISEADAKAEGSFLDRCPCLPRIGDRGAIEKIFRQNWCHIHGDIFNVLWDSINAKRGYGWDSNPWVWVIEFRRMEATT